VPLLRPVTDCSGRALVIGQPGTLSGKSLILPIYSQNACAHFLLRMSDVYPRRAVPGRDQVSQLVLNVLYRVKNTRTLTFGMSTTSFSSTTTSSSSSSSCPRRAASGRDHVFPAAALGIRDDGDRTTGDVWVIS
jgi:hypothetical protein